MVRFDRVITTVVLINVFTEIFRFSVKNWAEVLSRPRLGPESQEIIGI